MIIKDNNIDNLKHIFNEYKDDYNPIINDFTKIYCYTVKNEIVAFLIFNVIYEKAEIIDIFVKIDYRRQGIAFKLIKEIENDFDIENITLEVSENNNSAINLYEKLGFKIASIRKKYYKDSDAFLMLREVR